MSCPNSPPSGSSLLYLTLALGLLAAPPAFADRLTIKPKVSITQEYQTNPTGEENSSRAEADGVLKLSPSAEIELKEEQGRAKLEVGVHSRRYYTLDDLDADDPFFRGDFDYRATRRLSFFGDGSWSQEENRDPVENGGVQLQGGRPDVERWDASAGFRYLLGPRSNARLSYRHNGNDYTATEFSEPQRDFTTDSVTLSYVRTMSPRDTFTSSLTQNFTTFDEIESQDARGRGDQEDDLTSFTLGWTRILSRLWSASLTGGLRYLSSEGTQLFGRQEIEGSLFVGRDRFGNDLGIPLPVDPDGPDLVLPAVALQTDDSSTSFVGSFSLTRATELSTFNLSASQTTRPSSGRTGSLDVRSFGASLSRKLSERLTLRVSGTLTHQESASTVEAAVPLAGLEPAVDAILALQPDLDRGLALTGACLAYNPNAQLGQGTCIATFGDRTVDTDIKRFSIGLDWRMRRHLTTFLGYEYYDYESSVGRLGISGGDGQAYDDHRFRVGFRYQFGQTLF